MTPARDLADRFQERWLGVNPFAATVYGIPGYDDLVPDVSEEGAQAWRAELAQFLREADAIAPEPLPPADAVTLDCTREAFAQELAVIDMAQAEYTVTGAQYGEPSALLALTARAVELGAGLGLSGLAEVFGALRASAGKLPPADAMREAVTYLRGQPVAIGL